MDMSNSQGNLRIWLVRLSELELNFEVVHPPGVEHQAAYVLSRIPTTLMNELQLKDFVTVLPITEVQPEREKSKTDLNVTAGLSCNHEMDPVKPTLPQALQESK